MLVSGPRRSWDMEARNRSRMRCALSLASMAPAVAGDALDLEDAAGHRVGVVASMARFERTHVGMRDERGAERDEGNGERHGIQKTTADAPGGVEAAPAFRAERSEGLFFR